jgi:hypothetical protein
LIHRRRGQRRQAAGDVVVDELPEAVAVMLLHLVDEIDRQLQIDQQQRQAPGADEQRHQRQQE